MRLLPYSLRGKYDVAPIFIWGKYGCSSTCYWVLDGLIKSFDGLMDRMWAVEGFISSGQPIRFLMIELFMGAAVGLVFSCLAGNIKGWSFEMGWGFMLAHNGAGNVDLAHPILWVPGSGLVSGLLLDMASTGLLWRAASWEGVLVLFSLHCHGLADWHHGGGRLLIGSRVLWVGHSADAALAIRTSWSGALRTRDLRFFYT
ncbi:hypothetical protein E3N88_14136 [Mikania micrantha]|uniref:Uncharacterized protein n=1 Tax=Mikania micrantha TaxID=192012 RepID=A0A5N6P383_9ASTR|nr:hypothetical protein E3N88_14136 [Mikania micrantha]